MLLFFSHALVLLRMFQILVASVVHIFWCETVKAQLPWTAHFMSINPLKSDHRNAGHARFIPGFPCQNPSEPSSKWDKPHWLFDLATLPHHLIDGSRIFILSRLCYFTFWQSDLAMKDLSFIIWWITRRTHNLIYIYIIIILAIVIIIMIIIIYRYIIYI